MSIRTDILQVCITYHPKVPIHRIHEATKYSLACSRRFREMRVEGIIDYAYNHADKYYYIRTSIKDLTKALKAEVKR